MNNISTSQASTACIKIGNRGLTIVEILVAIAVMVIIAAFSFSAFSRFNKYQKVKNTASEIMSVLEKARSQTLAAKGNMRYGVHFETVSVTLFSGTVYTTSAPDNEITIFSSNVVAATTLSGGGSDILFERLTGKTSNDGTILISFVSYSNASTTITVHKTGLVEL